MGYHSWRLRRGSLVLAAVLLTAAVIGVGALTHDEAVIPVWGFWQKGIAGESEAERLAFLTEHGWQAELPEVECREITVPAEFDEVYEQYAALQEQQGLPLQKYAGKTATEYTYHITNYPDCDDVVAHLLVYRGRIIAADLSSTEQDGFTEAVIRTENS